MSYLARLKQQLSPDAVKGEPTKPSKAPSVGFVGSHSAPLRDFSDQWREFENLLVIVGAAYRTPAHEYAVIREIAKRDLQAALLAFKDLASQIESKAS